MERASAAKVTLRRLLLAWTTAGFGVWLALALAAVPEGDDRLIPGWGWLMFYAVYVGIAFFFSGLLIAAVWTLVNDWRQHRRGRSTARP